jgi:mono/diheme cytochrome c family protein
MGEQNPRKDEETGVSDPCPGRGSRLAVLGSAVIVLTVLSASVTRSASSPVPAEFQSGAAKFTAMCAQCHGPEATGTKQGPPLVHKIYEPNHHGDAAFQRAAANGVRAHHWQFGDMPKIEGAKPEDVDQIVKYVRWLQRQAGIM